MYVNLIKKPGNAQAGPGPRGPRLGPGRQPLVLYLFRLQLRGVVFLRFVMLILPNVRKFTLLLIDVD